MTGSCIKACGVALLSLACAGSAGSASDTKAPAPSGAAKDGEMLVTLPASLVSQIKKDYPEYRVPSRGDLTGAWAEGTRATYPFMATGDFDGDQRTDTALILLGDGDWKFVVFHQKERGPYQSFDLLTVPNPGSDGSGVQTWTLTVMRKGVVREKELYDEDEHDEGKTPSVKKYKFPVDALNLIHSDAGDILYHWAGGKYEEIEFGYE